MKGLICAGGSATRLAELTRVTNKHLLPVGSWPMVYYPLQLLQRLGVREVLLVTGQQHAGQFIDLLGDGKVEERGGGELLFELDLSYKVQTEPGGIAQVVGMARDFAAGDRLVVCLGDNIFEHAQREAVEAWDGGAVVFVKDVPDPENFGVVAYDGDGSVSDIVEKAGIVDTRYDSPPSSDAVVGLYCYPPEVFEIVDVARALEPRRARDHRRQPRVRPARPAAGRACRGLVARRRQALAGPRRGRPADRADGREQVIEGVELIPLKRFEDERGWFMELMRASKLPQPVKQSNLVVLARRA